MAQPSADRLALLYRVSQTFNSSLDLDEVLNRVIDEVIDAVRAERGFLMLHDADGQLRFRVARGLDRNTIEQPAFQVSRSVVQRVAEEGRALLTSDAQGDDWLKTHRSVAILGLRAVLCVPLQLKDTTLGVIYVDNRVQTGIFTSDDLDLLTAIAASAATAIENARLYQVAVEKGRLERELQMARDLQTSLLPRETPQLAGWDFAGYWQPARQVSGDFYDFILLGSSSFDSTAGAQPAHVPLANGEGVGRSPSASPAHRAGYDVASTPLRSAQDAPTASFRMNVLIADVSDKGMPAALFMALSRSILRASLSRADIVADGIAQANRLICADSPNSMFVTLFCAQVDPTGGVTYVNAGHNLPYFFHNATDQPQLLRRTGMALGIDDTALYDQYSIQLEPGACLILYTDGFLDALNAQQEEFGEARLRRVCAEHRHQSAAEIVAAVRAELAAFVGKEALADDCALVVVKRV